MKINVLSLFICLVGLLAYPAVAATNSASPLESFKLDNKPLTLQKLLDAKPAPQSKKSQKAPIKASEKIGKISVEGNSKVPTDLILNQIRLSIDSKYQPFAVNRSKRSIQSMGVFEDVSSRVEILKNSKKHIIFKVIENPTIQKINVEGSETLTSDYLMAMLSSKEGELKNKNLIRRDISAIQDMYNNLGYSQARVLAAKTTGQNNDILTFIVSEGVVEEIVVTGNEKTKDYVILREMTLKPGAPFKQETFNADLRKIFNLNYFNGLDYDIQPGKSPDGVKLVIKIDEKKSSGQLTFGGGYSAELGFSLFSDFFMDNIFGTGQLVMLKGQFYFGGSDYSGQNSTYQFKYSNPWMFGKRHSFTFKTWYTAGFQSSTDFLSSNRDLVNAIKKGFDVTFGVPLSYNLKTFHTFRDEVVQLPDEFVKFKVDSYKFAIQHDTRDVWFNPKNGGLESFAIEKSFNFYSDSLDFTKYDVNLLRFYEVFDNQVLALRYDMGLIESPGVLERDTFVGMYYVMGGGTTVRGYDERGFAYGAKKSLLSVEYRFIFNETFQAVMFADTGIATMGNLYELSRYRIGKGVGMRMNVPGMGPLRLDFGFDDTGAMRTHFSLGHSF